MLSSLAYPTVVCGDAPLTSNRNKPGTWNRPASGVVKKRQAGNNFTPARRPEPRSSEELAPPILARLTSGLLSGRSGSPKRNNGPVGAKKRQGGGNHSPVRRPDQHPSSDDFELHQKSELAKLMSKAEERISKTQQMWGEAVGPRGWSFPEGISEEIQKATTHSGKGILASLLAPLTSDQKSEIEDVLADEETAPPTAEESSDEGALADEDKAPATEESIEKEGRLRLLI